MINAGDTVTWKWDDGTDHSVTSDTGIWDSGVKSGGPPFPQISRTFTAPGTFPYHCVIHGGPGGAGMSGTVTVMQPALPSLRRSAVRSRPTGTAS